MSKTEKTMTAQDSEASRRFLAIGKIEDDELFIASLAELLVEQFGYVNPAQRLNCIFLKRKYRR